jgi:hypothetical protein
VLRAIEHVRYPPSVRVSDKAGAENTGDAQDKKRKTTKKYPETLRNAGVQVAHNRLLPERVAGGAGAGPARLKQFT